MAGTFAAVGAALIPTEAPPLSAADVSATVQVVPADLGAHGGMLGAFILADPSGTVYLETAVEAQITGRSALTERAALIFDRLRADALPRAASRDLIVKVAHERWEH